MDRRGTAVTNIIDHWKKHTLSHCIESIRNISKNSSNSEMSCCAKIIIIRAHIDLSAGNRKMVITAGQHKKQYYTNTRDIYHLRKNHHIR